jgi:prefoldin subunit 5
MTDRTQALEEALDYAERKLEALSSTLYDKEQRITALESRLDAVERALRIVASRNSGSDSPSGLSEEDPVPSSG